MGQWSGKAQCFFSYADKCFPVDKATMEITHEVSAQMDRDLVHADSAAEESRSVFRVSKSDAQ